MIFISIKIIKMITKNVAKHLTSNIKVWQLLIILIEVKLAARFQTLVVLREKTIALTVGRVVEVTVQSAGRII
jgi:hypothetical protein